jgi:hypothetical protein
MNYLVQEAQKAAMAIREGVDEMRLLWPPPCSIYVVADFKRLERLNVLKQY